MNLPNPEKLCLTIGVLAMKESKKDYMFELALANQVKEDFNKQLDECFDGGNDKFFFSTFFRGVKLFVATNELCGLTVMLPEEY